MPRTFGDGDSVKRKPLNAERLREVLNYDPETGVFTWLAQRGGAMPAGSRAGGTNGNGYVIIKVDQVAHRAHRLAWLYMTGGWPSGDVDHRNGARADNSWANLRGATRQQNMGNTAAYRSNALGLKGVYESFGRFRAQIGIDGKMVRLGRFGTAEDAARAYDAAALAHFGEFAVLNFPTDGAV